MPIPFPARPTQPAGLSAIATLPFLAIPFLVLLLVWVPEFAHFSVPHVRVSDSMIEAARQSPQDALLDELGGFTLLSNDGRRAGLEVSIAEGILMGRLELPGSPVGQVSLPFSSDDLDGLPAELQLPYAGFVVPDILLAAYVQSGREEFFTAADRFIASWDRYEQHSLLPRGYLWNDHAVAARVRVLAKFWQIYRPRPDYNEDAGRSILEQAARYGHFLSSPDHFTFATNHGVMQNLGLLQLSLAFPTLPESAQYHQVALERLGRQLAFYIDEEGVIRENSAGYQAFGMDLLAMTFRCMALLGDPVPEMWTQRYAAGLLFLDSLRRPDGTLPASGDTDGASIGDYPRVTTVDAAGMATPLRPFEARGPDRAETLDAAAGYWIDWHGLQDWPAGEALGQTVVTWTTPPSPGHKHADEMSVLLWSDGTSWLTSVGYWPYTDPGRSQAEGWDGADAPHLVGESALSRRSTRLISHGADGQIAAIDLERTGPGEFRARRQVVRVGADVWVVLDTISAAATETNRTVWTTSSDVELEAADEPGSYELRSRTSQATARIDYLGSGGTELREYHGSQSPLVGWHVVDSTPQPAPAIVVEQPAGDAWLAVVVSRTGGTSNSGSVTGPPLASRVSSADDWAMTLPTASGQVDIRRSGESIVVSRPGPAGEASASVDLVPGPDVTGEVASVRAAFDSMAGEYPVHQSQSSRRTAVSFLVLLLALCQEVVLLAVRRWLPSAHVPLRMASAVCWVGVAVWLSAVFLRSWEVVALIVGHT